MAVVNLSGTMGSPFVDKFFKAYNELDEDEMLLAYVSSFGGSTYTTDMICDLVDKLPDRFMFIFVEFACSAAANLALRLKCEKSLYPGTMAIFHLPRFSSEVTINNNLLDGYENYLDRAATNKLIRLYKDCGFTEEEIKTIKAGEDCHMKFNRFRTVFNNSKNL